MNMEKLVILVRGMKTFLYNEKLPKKLGIPVNYFFLEHGWKKMALTLYTKV